VEPVLRDDEVDDVSRAERHRALDDRALQVARDELQAARAQDGGERTGVAHLVFDAKPFSSVPQNVEPNSERDMHTE